MYRQLDEKVLVSGQISPADVPELRRHGVTMIVNNRPDGEDDGQPLAADIEAAAEAEGIGYCHVPIARGMGPSHVEAMREALNSCADGKVLAFCRSGTRSTWLWALARKAGGGDGGEIIRQAAAAGYDLSPLAGLLLR